MNMGKFYVYDSIPEFTAACRSRNMGDGGSQHWAGGTRQDAYNYCKTGDLSHVPDAEMLVDRVLSEIDTEDLIPRWEPDVVGFQPIVPAYLAGVPETMLARHEAASDRAAIEIWANTTVSANCSAKDMVRRGVVTLALAMAIDRIRPVKLVVYSTTSHSSCAVRLASPLDFSEVCAAFCQPSFTRQLMYFHAFQDGWITKWSEWSEVMADEETERRALMELGGMPENAIHLSTERLGSYASVGDDELVQVLNDKVRAAIVRE